MSHFLELGLEAHRLTAKELELVRWEQELADPKRGYEARIRELEEELARYRDDENIITREELADALRESPKLGKQYLLNRTKGVLRAATRKGTFVPDL